MIDAELRPARWNIAFDQALMELHRDGHHQALAREIRLDWCQANGVEIALPTRRG